MVQLEDGHLNMVSNNAEIVSGIQIGINKHIVCQQNLPHNITPPPLASNVDSKQVGSMES